MDSTIPYKTIRSEIGDPIQLSEIRPVKCDSLVRIGSDNDGGYVVPLEAVKSAHALISFGLSHDWTFERDFKALNPNAIIHCYDHTVNLLTAFTYSIGQLLRFVLLFRTNSLRKSLTWIDYKTFFRGDKVHFRQRIWRDNDNNSATIENAFDRLPGKIPVFVKMDIEGGEYRVLDDLLMRSSDIVAMAIEFHDVDILSSPFNSLISQIKENFYIVHVHGNNMGGVTKFNFPMAPEITFLNKVFFDSLPPPSKLHYPVSGLDSPNHPRLPEFRFEF